MAEESPNPPVSRGTQFPIKWIVFGVVAIAFMLIFKGELGGLLDRTVDLQITTEGVKIKTVETPIGKTDVSVVPIAKAPQASTGVQGTTYTSTEYAFQISWPNNSEWTADQAVGRQMMQSLGLPATIDIPIAIISNQFVDNFRPNVNVVVEKVGAMDIEQYLNLTKQNLIAEGWQVVSSNIDPKTQGGVIVLLNDAFGNQLYQFQKIAMGNGNAYVITASQVPTGNQLTGGLKADLQNIINSFRLIQ